MSLLDALLIAGGGAAKGYRASQELQRQIAEQKRKALMDEEAQALQSRQQALQERLGSSTIASEGVARANALAAGQRGAAEYTHGLESAAGMIPGYDTSHMNKNELDHVSDIVAASLRNQADIRIKQLELEHKTEHPELYGGSAKHMTPAERANKALTLISGDPSIMGQPLDVQDQLIRMRMKHFSLLDPEAGGMYMRGLATSDSLDNVVKQKKQQYKDYLQGIIDDKSQPKSEREQAKKLLKQYGE